MKGVESTETMFRGVASQQQLSAVVALFDQTLNDELLGFPTVGNVGQELASILRVYRAGSHLDRRNGGEFYQRQTRSENAVSASGKDASDGSRSLLVVEQFSQRAGIEEKKQRLMVSALLNDQVGERTRDVFPALCDFFNGFWDAAAFGKVGLALGEVLMVESVVKRFDGEDDPFSVVERYGLNRADDTFVENGFYANGHASSVGEFLREDFFA